MYHVNVMFPEGFLTWCLRGDGRTFFIRWVGIKTFDVGRENNNSLLVLDLSCNISLMELPIIIKTITVMFKKL